MGVAAAVGVAIAVLIALTLLPALLGFAGEKLRPKLRKHVRAEPVEAPGAPSTGSGQRLRQAQGTSRVLGGVRGLARRWVRLVTAVPVLTVVLVVAGLGAMAYPAKDLRIALPSNGTADPGSHARVTYDLVAEHFGLGYNGPLIVSATIVGSDDPLGVMDGIADESAGAARSGQCAAGHAERRRQHRDRPGDPGRRTRQRADQGPRPGDPVDEGPDRAESTASRSTSPGTPPWPSTSPTGSAAR